MGFLEASTGDAADWEELSAAELEKLNNIFSSQREEIINKQLSLAPIWERKIREERALANMQARKELNGEVPADQVIAPDSIPSEEQFGSM